MFSRSDRLRPNTISNRLNGTKSNKSSVDDLDMELGIVRVRVGLSYDPLRLSPSSGDLWFNHIIMCTCICMCIPLPLTTTTKQQLPQQQQTPLKKPPCRCYSLITSLFYPSNEGTGKGNDERSATWWLFFSVRFRYEVLGHRSESPLAHGPAPWTMHP